MPGHITAYSVEPSIQGTKNSWTSLDSLTSPLTQLGVIKNMAKKHMLQPQRRQPLGILLQGSFSIRVMSCWLYHKGHSLRPFPPPPERRALFNEV